MHACMCIQSLYMTLPLIGSTCILNEYCSPSQVPFLPQKKTRGFGTLVYKERRIIFFFLSSLFPFVTMYSTDLFPANLHSLIKLGVHGLLVIGNTAHNQPASRLQQIYQPQQTPSLLPFFSLRLIQRYTMTMLELLYDLVEGMDIPPSCCCFVVHYY